MAGYFETITQYDKKFGEKYGKIDFNACSLFALITAKKFFSNKNLSKETHENNLNCAVLNHKMMGKGDISFDNLLHMTSLKPSQVMGTCVELIKENIVGYDMMLPQDKTNYCVIFLKNSKYFTVMCYDGKYSIRDCHEICQYDFKERKEMIDRLNETYQFDKVINAGGMELPEFSNVEFLIIENDFNLNKIELYDDTDNKINKKMEQIVEKLKYDQTPKFMLHDTADFVHEEVICDNDDDNDDQENESKNYTTPDDRFVDFE
jgi:hypothetical protein